MLNFKTKYEHIFRTTIEEFELKTVLYIPFAFYLDREPARKQIVRLQWTCLFVANSSTG